MAVMRREIIEGLFHDTLLHLDREFFIDFNRWHKNNTIWYWMNNDDHEKCISGAPLSVRGLLNLFHLLDKSISPEVAGGVKSWIYKLNSKLHTRHDLSSDTWEVMWKIQKIINKFIQWWKEFLLDAEFSEIESERIRKHLGPIITVLRREEPSVRPWVSTIFRKDVRVPRSAMEEINELLNNIVTDHKKFTQHIHEQRSQFRWLMDEMKAVTSSSVTGHKQSCDDGTRIQHQNEIKEWLREDSTQNVLWLSGEANCGKSTVAMSIADYCRLYKVQGPMLFIDSGSLDTTNPDKYFATLTAQLLQSVVHRWQYSDVSTAMQQHLCDILRDEPTLLHRITIHQATRLFVETVKKFSPLSAPLLLYCHMVIIIDGFDNTDSDRIHETAGIFSSMFEELASDSTLKVRFLVCSRDHTLFRSSGNIRNLRLDASEPYPNMVKYISRQLSRIFEAFQLDPQQLLFERHLGMIANQASHNIFKALAVKDIVERYLTRDVSNIVDLPEFLELLSADIATAQSTFHEQDRPQDIQTASSLLEEILENPQRYRHLLNSNNRETQVILDGCQEGIIFFKLLDFPDNFASSKRGEIIAAMYRLSTKTGLYPHYLVLDQGTFSKILDNSEAVSSGAFGDIYKVWYRGEYLCLKTSRPNKEFTVNMAKVFTKEAIIWSLLSHTNILPFFGICIFKAKLSLVAPWAEQGNIRQYLSRTRLDHPNRILLVADVAAGINYLHENEMVHGDIKTENVLVDRSGRAYVADFGLSNVQNSQIAHWATQSSVASKGGTPRYQAPELHRIESDDVEASSGRSIIHNTKETDVYAWGGLCYEILSDKVPFHEISNEFAVVFHIMNRHTPTRPPDDSDAWLIHGLTQELWGCLEQCWSYEPMSRPTMADIVSYLTSIKPRDDRPNPQWTQGTARLFRVWQQKFGLQSTGSSDRLDALIDSLSKLVSTTETDSAQSNGSVI